MLFQLAFLYTFQTDLNYHTALKSMYHSCFVQLQEPEEKIPLSHEELKQQTLKRILFYVGLNSKWYQKYY